MPSRIPSATAARIPTVMASPKSISAPSRSYDPLPDSQDALRPHEEHDDEHAEGEGELEVDRDPVRADLGDDAEKHASDHRAERGADAGDIPREDVERPEVPRPLDRVLIVRPGVGAEDHLVRAAKEQRESDRHDDQRHRAAASAAKRSPQHDIQGRTEATAGNHREQPGDDEGDAEPIAM